MRSLFQALLDLASLHSGLAAHRWATRASVNCGLSHGAGGLSLEAPLHTDAEQAGGPHAHRHQGFSLKMMQIETMKLPMHVGTMDPCGNQGMRWKHRPLALERRQVGEYHWGGRSIVQWAGAWGSFGPVVTNQRLPTREPGGQGPDAGSHWGATSDTSDLFSDGDTEVHQGGGFPYCWVTGFRVFIPTCQLIKS